MKNSILLRLGLLIFAYTVIVSYHLSNSKYNLIKTSTTQENGGWLPKGTADMGHIPINKYLEQEDYYELINGHAYSRKIIPMTTKAILPFQNSSRNFITMFLLLSITLIILTMNLKDFLGKKLVIIAVSLLLWSVFDAQKAKINLSNNASVEYSISDMKKEVESQENRISDLENY